MSIVKKPQTYRYRLSLFVNKVSKSLFNDEFYLRKKIKPFLIGFLKVKYRKGFPVNIGGVQQCLLDPVFYFANWENFGGGHNSGFEECVQEATKSNVFFDIGAHIGLYSVPIALKSKNTKVVSFEPATFNFNMLNRHVSLNNLSNVKVYNVLVGESEDKKVPFLEDDTGINPMNSLADVDKTEGNSTNYKEMIQIDSFCERENIYPDVVKIDVEGAEVLVLNGAKKAFSKSRPKIFLSLHPKHIQQLGGKLEDIHSFAQELDYKITTIDGQDNMDFHDNEVLLAPN
ncbi:MAG: FkbM family methyltransferase [Oligoflexia bacterium]|nr:FkbM family methyltransferase [Oligoflexia bacterium]